MDLQQFYLSVGGKYEDALKILPTDKLIEKFLLKFIQDPSFLQLCAAFEQGDAHRAFMAAHTLKGVCGNLVLGNLFSAASTITEALRHAQKIEESHTQLLDIVKAEYNNTVDMIESYSAQKNN